MSKCKCALSLLNAMDWYQKYFLTLRQTTLRGQPEVHEKLWQGEFKQQLVNGLDTLAHHCDVKTDKIKEALQALTIPGVPTTLLELDEEVGFKIIKLVDDCAKEEI